MKRTLMALAAGLVLVAAAGCAQPYGRNPEMMGAGGSAGWHGAHGMGMGWGMMWDDPALGLTQEQRAGIAGVQAEFRRRQSALMEKMHQDDGHSTAPEGLFDEPAARKAYDAMAELQRQLFENSLEERKQIDSLLTPQQREQIQMQMRQLQQLQQMCRG